MASSAALHSLTLDKPGDTESFVKRSETASATESDCLHKPPCASTVSLSNENKSKPRPAPVPPEDGYDDEIFLSPPPKDLQCIICLLTVREPHLITCCGAIICKLCVMYTRAESECPHCRDTSSHLVVPDKRTKGQTMSLKVKCINGDCEWRGELVDYNNHITKKCPNRVVQCQYSCGLYFVASEVSVHEEEECSRQPYAGMNSDTSDSELVGEQTKTVMSPQDKPPDKVSLGSNEVGIERSSSKSQNPHYLHTCTDDVCSGDTDESKPPDIQKSLYDAVKRGNLVKVREFHEMGARLADFDSSGLTPLHHAARLGRKEVVEYIVNKVPREALDLQDEDKAQTALHKAAWYGYHGICKILVEANASLLRTDYQGNTPYLKSIECEDIKLQEYLRRKEIEQRMKLDI